MLLLNFLGIGASKSGTTWVHDGLDKHPEIFVPPRKEIHFFSSHFDKGFGWYERQFRGYSGESCVGEISPSYAVTPEVPHRIHAWSPDIRLMYFIRNPIARIYSQYCMKLRNKNDIVSVNVDLEVDKYLEHGLYYKNLVRFLEYFPRHQILVLIFDDLKEDPMSFIQEVYSYLDVDSSFIPATVYSKKNVRKSRPKYDKIYKLLFSNTRIIAHTRLYQKYVRQTGFEDYIYRVLPGRNYPELSQDKERSLAEFYFEDLCALSEWLERDLTYWLRPYLDIT